MKENEISQSAVGRTLAKAPAVPTVLVLGAGYAGLLAALRIAGKVRGQARVVLVNDGDHFVERVRLHQVAVGQRVLRRSLEQMTRGTGIELVDGHASELDAASKRVTVKSASGSRIIGFDYLLYALGSVGKSCSVPGVASHAHDLSSEAGADRVMTAVAALAPGARVSVVGGGLTGIEVAAELAEARPDLAVSLVAERIAPDFSERGRAYVLESLRDLGVRAREGARVTRVGEAEIELSSGEIEESDLTIWCGGFQTGSSELAKSFAKTARGQLALDGFLVSRSFGHVFGAGDGAAIDVRAAEFIRMSCAAAMPMAAHAADNVVRRIRGEALEPFGFAFAGRCVSLGRKRGILQRVTPDDVAIDSVVSGWLGARIKEAICRYTTISLAIERVLPGTYTWPGRKRALASDALLTA